MTVDAIKDLIEHLQPDDQAKLAGWITSRDREAWDAEIERDFSPGGVGMALLADVDAQLDSLQIDALPANPAVFRVSRPHARAD